MNVDFDAIAARLTEAARAAEAESDRLDRLIRRHEKKRDSLRHPNAKDYLEEVFAIACSRIEDASFEISGPFGLGPEYGVSVTAPLGRAHFSFRGGSITAKLIDHDSDNGAFAGTSLGRLNGFHHDASPLDPDPDILVAMVRARMAENRLRSMGGSAAA